MKVPKFIFRYYAFNLFNRDKWIKDQSILVPNGSSILDVGAGSAPYRKLFGHCNYKTHDFAQLTHLQLRGYQGYNKIDFVSDICNIPVPNHSFDYILCTEVIEHVPEPISAISEISRILKPGGTLILTAPLGSGLHQEPFHYYGGYTPHFYNKILKDCGFSKIEISPNMGFHSFFSQELIRLVRRLAPWKGYLNFLLLPIWTVFFLLAIVFPLVSPILDHFDKNQDFTVGYHVKAVKLEE